MDFQSARDAYPVNQQLTWLNNSGTTPAGRHITARMARHYDQLATVGPEQTEPSLSAVYTRIKGHLATFLNASPDDIALIHNTAEGMNLLSLGLNLVPGDEILLLENEYPSNVYPWQAWAAKGITPRFVPAGGSPEAFLGELMARLTSRTRVVALSMVHWCTGMPLPYVQVAEVCHERGILFVLDGSQGVGHLPLDFGALAPAALCFSAWKWLLGPLGLGVLIADRTTVSGLASPFRGPDSVLNSSSYLPYQTAQKETAERYRYSTANTNDWVYFDESLLFLASLGMPNVQRRILELAERLWTPLRTAGFTSAYDHGAQPSTGILCVEKPGVDMARVAKTLAEQGIVSRVRLGRLRLAPHIYLGDEQIDRAAALLIQAARSD